jgi:ABC-type anion transport system duplicated permease subunit
MKQKDLALILVIAVIGGIASIFVSKIIFVNPKNREQQVEVVQPITADFPPPSSAYFNSNALDPTELITIGSNANPNPF